MAVKEDVIKNFGSDIILSGNSIVDKKSVIIQKVVLLYLQDSPNVVKLQLLWTLQQPP